MTGGALFYLAGSVLAIGAFFLLVELVERGREVGADVLAVTREAFGTGGDESELEEQDIAGVAIPATVAILGLSFLTCALVLAGLPPFSGFLAKFAMLAPLLRPGDAGVPIKTWVLMTALILSGLATLIAMLRTGIEVFWANPAGRMPRISLLEFAPVGLLLLLCGALTVAAGPAMDYMQATAEALHAPKDYLRGVMEPPAAAPGGGR